MGRGNAKRRGTARSVVQTRGPKFGHCNICDVECVLTEDHVPPKGTLGIPQKDLFHLIDLLDIDRPVAKRQSRVMQSGVKYRSLCARCNNTLLGSKYDPALIDFSNRVAAVLKSTLIVPSEIRIQMTPGLVVRSVLGHLLAVGIERRERTHLLTEAIRFFEDSTLPLPAGLECFVWLYPYKTQIAVRDAALLPTLNQPPIVFWCLKYFPVGFMFTWANDHPESLPLIRLRDYMINAGNHDVELPLRMNSIQREQWPESPGDDGAVLFGQDAIAAMPRNG